MAKLRVHELAKELDKQSKDIINLLHDKGVDVKNHMTTLEDRDVDFVKKAFGSTGKGSMAENSKISDADHKEEHKTEEVQKKKKNIIFVSNPQNSKLPGGASNLPPHSTNTKPAVKPASAAQPAKAVTTEQPAAVKAEAKQEAVKIENQIKESQNQTHTEAKTETKPTPVVPKETTSEQSSMQTSTAKETPQVAVTTEATPAKPQTQADSTAKTYNNTNGQNRSYNNDGQNRTYNNAGGQSRPYNNDGQSRPYNNAGGQSRPYNNDGQSRPYNNAGGQNRPYNNAGGQNRPYNNDRFQKGDGREDNRFGKPQGAKPFSGDSPIIQPEKRRDEAKRKLGQEKDSRSKRDKIYEDDAMKAKPGRFIKPEKKPKEAEEQIKVIVLPEILTIKELADKMKIQPSAIVKKLFLQGQIVTVNQEITYDAAEEIALEYEIMCEKEVVVDVIEELLREEEESADEMTARPPVICVMGHVDHGKTSLLDAIRKTNVTDKEAGGITQHIGAYTVNIKDQKITFLDTPGHEAFTSMRMRGANATDIAILVVAADDGVMPQTVEAISHAKAAGIEIIVAVNKIDKPNANIDRVKQELTEYELIPEDWGGSTVYAPVSAKTGDGIEQLLEMILLTSEILELKANPMRTARGLVIEAQLDKGRGPVATILVQKGTLHVGDFIAAGSCHGKVRAMIDDKGRRVKEAGPSTPVEILGLNDVPNAGDVFVAPENDKEAKQFADTFIAQNREKMLEDTKAKMSLDDLFTQIQAGNLKELNIIIKADVQGSVEAVKQSLVKLSNEEVVVKVIHGGVGAINESDVILASASKAIIIGFNVRHDATAKATAEREGVDLRLYKVIYQAIEDVEAAMKGMLDPVFEEKIIGHAEIRQIFKASAIGNIAGSYVLDGTLQRNCKVRISREGKQVFEGELEALKRFKDDVKEVKAGFECGLTFTGFDQFQELDIVEAYIMVEVPR